MLSSTVKISRDFRDAPPADDNRRSSRQLASHLSKSTIESHASAFRGLRRRTESIDESNMSKSTTLAEWNGMEWNRECDYSWSFLNNHCHHLGELEELSLPGVSSVGRMQRAEIFACNNKQENGMKE